MFTRFTVWFRFVVIVGALAIPVSAMSQSFYGSLVAVVEDAQGGVMPGATIVLINTGTNERRDGVSAEDGTCLLYTSPSPRDRTRSRMPSSA